MILFDLIHAVIDPLVEIAIGAGYLALGLMAVAAILVAIRKIDG